jgi:hypothetical protein
MDALAVKTYGFDKVRYGCDWVEANEALWETLQWNIKVTAQHEDMNEATRKSMFNMVERIARAA